MKEERDPESRAIIAEFFSAGQKDYEPKDFIDAVRGVAREASAETAAAPAAKEDDTIVANTEVAATLKASGTAAQLAWSDESETQDLAEQRSRRWIVPAVLCALAAAALVAVVVVYAGQRSPSAPMAAPATTAPTTAPVPAAAPPPATVTVTAPPPVTVTAAAPPEPALEGVDARFISFLRNNDVGSIYVNVSNATAISNAHLICKDMLNHTGFDNVADNLGLSSAQIAWFADTASANYCPQFGGDV